MTFEATLIFVNKSADKEREIKQERGLLIKFAENFKN